MSLRLLYLMFLPVLGLVVLLGRTLVFRSLTCLAGRFSTVPDTPVTARLLVVEAEEGSIDGSYTTLVRVIRRCFPMPRYRARYPICWPCFGPALPLRPSARSSGWLLV